MNRLYFILPMVIFIALVGFFMRGLSLNPRDVPSPMICKTVPEFDLPPLKDSKPALKDADLKGAGVVLINFFASWCAPCRVEHPLLMELAEKKTLPVIGIAYKDKPEDTKAWLDRYGDPYTRIAVDRDGRTAIDWGVYGVPESYLVDNSGRILYKHVGPLTREKLAKDILPKLKDGGCK
jgi:cytochrome c biogenesis protein CcmG/thiol:disulfide interchange protein DsbE